MEPDKSRYNYYNKKLQPVAHMLRGQMTKAEACLWKYALRAGLMCGYTFRRQRPVLNYVADFMCQELKLIIEVDGITHTWEENHAKDKLREDALKSAGFTVLRFTDSEVLSDIKRVSFAISCWIEDYEKRNGK